MMTGSRGILDLEAELAAALAHNQAAAERAEAIRIARLRDLPRERRLTEWASVAREGHIPMDRIAAHIEREVGGMKAVVRRQEAGRWAGWVLVAGIVLVLSGLWAWGMAIRTHLEVSSEERRALLLLEPVGYEWSRAMNVDELRRRLTLSLPTLELLHRVATLPKGVPEGLPKWFSDEPPRIGGEKAVIMFLEALSKSSPSDLENGVKLLKLVFNSSDVSSSFRVKYCKGMPPASSDYRSQDRPPVAQ